MSPEKAQPTACGPFSTSLKDISIDLKAGEIVGVGGVAGGQRARRVFRCNLRRVMTKADAGSITINGKPVGNLGVNARRLMGASFIPEERLGMAQCQDETIGKSPAFACGHGCKSLHEGRATEAGEFGRHRHATKRISQDMDVRKSAEDPEASALSGGNLQKFLSAAAN